MQLLIYSTCIVSFHSCWKELEIAVCRQHNFLFIVNLTLNIQYNFTLNSDVHIYSAKHRPIIYRHTYMQYSITVMKYVLLYSIYSIWRIYLTQYYVIEWNLCIFSWTSLFFFQKISHMKHCLKQCACRWPWSFDARRSAGSVMTSPVWCVRNLSRPWNILIGVYSPNVRFAA